MRGERRENRAFASHCLMIVPPQNQWFLYRGVTKVTRENIMKKGDIMNWLENRAVSVFIAGVALIVAVSLAINGFVGYRQNSVGGITATGSATIDFSSDLIVWRGSFSAYGSSTQEAYGKINRDASLIKSYLVDHNVPETDFVFSSVDISPNYHYTYDANGYMLDQTLVGYSLSQRLVIQSSDVDNIENISRDISELISAGVDFHSDAPEYYYTKLGELKLELIRSATTDAKTRIDIMAVNAGGKLDNLLSSDLGTFQITAQNSAEDSYLYGGAFNTWSREKTMFVAVTLHYALK